MKISRSWVGIGVGVLMMATIVIGIVRTTREPRVTIGKNDEIYYYRKASREDALALGKALQGTGFLNDRGTSVFLRIGGGPTLVSFVVDAGAWTHPHVVSNFTELGRRVATSVGGFPIQVQLIDADRTIHKKMIVGKENVGARDVMYYFGTATGAEAKALGETLRSAGYFTDRGVTVALLKGEGTAISFVVADGLWDRPEVVTTLEGLVRRVAPAAGGLPIEMRMLDRNMDIKRAVTVE